MPPRTLIVFYSLSGTTEGLARDLMAALPAGSRDLERLRERQERKGWRGISRCVSDAISRRKSELMLPRYRPGDFDVVLVGTPIWMGRISAPARSYLASQGFGSARLGVFATTGGLLNAATMRDIQAACPKRPVDVLQLTTRETHDGAKIDAFLRAMDLTSRVDVVQVECAPMRLARG